MTLADDEIGRTNASVVWSGISLHFSYHYPYYNIKTKKLQSRIHNTTSKDLYLDGEIRYPGSSTLCRKTMMVAHPLCVSHYEIRYCKDHQCWSDCWCCLLKLSPLQHTVSNWFQGSPSDDWPTRERLKSYGPRTGSDDDARIQKRCWDFFDAGKDEACSSDNFDIYCTDGHNVSLPSPDTNQPYRIIYSPPSFKSP